MVTLAVNQYGWTGLLFAKVNYLIDYINILAYQKKSVNQRRRKVQSMLNNLTSIQWWIGVVVVGIFINLISIFIRNKLDGFFSKLSSWWRNRSAKRKLEFIKEVSRLKNNPEELIAESITELKLINKSVHSLLMSAIFFIIVIGVVNILASAMLKTNIFDKIMISITNLAAALKIFESFYFYNMSKNCEAKIRAAKEDLGTLSPQLKSG